MTKFKASFLFISSILLVSTVAFGIQDLVFQSSNGKQVSLKSSPASQTGSVLLPKIQSTNQQLTLLDQASANVTVSPPLIGGGKFGLDYSSLGLDLSANFIWTGTHSWAGKFIPPYGSTLPSTCTPPELFILTAAPTGKRLYVCESTDTWILEGDGTADIGDGDLVNSYIPFISNDALTGSSNLTFVDGDPGTLALQGNLAVGSLQSQHAATIKGVLSIASGALPSNSPNTSQGYGLFFGTDSLSTGESRILTYKPSGSTYLSFWTNSESEAAAERARFDSAGNFTLMPDSSLTHVLKFRELASNGVNSVGIKSPTSLNGNITLTLPSATPSDISSGFMKSDTSGTLSFAKPGFSDLSGTISVTQGGNGESPTGADQVAVSSSTSDINWTTLSNCTGSNALSYNATTHLFGCVAAGSGGGGGVGTVTSVGISAPTEFTITNSPVTTSGNLTLTKATQTAKSVYAGPLTGSPAQPTFRSLVDGDIPNITSSNKVGWSSVNKTGSNISDLGSILKSSTFSNLPIDSNGSLLYCSDCADTNPCSGSGSGAIGRRINNIWDCGGGAVKSVGLSMPGEFSVSSSPVTSTGTLTVAKSNQSSGLVYAAPSSPNPSGTPSFRALVPNDLPTSIPATKLANGQITNEKLQTLSDISTASTIQAQLDSKIGSNETAAKYVLAGPTSGASSASSFRLLVPTDLPDSIPATKLANGDVSDTELQTLNGISTASTIQVQLDSKFSKSDTQSSGLVYSAPPSPGPVGTPGFRRLVQNDLPDGISSTKLANGEVADNELQTLNGISTASTIQAQLDSKISSSATQSANTVFAGPSSGSATTPAFRSLTSNDIPSGIDQTKITGLSTSLNGKVSTSTTIYTGTGLTGGGDLTANKTLSFDYSPTAYATPGAGKCVFSSSVGGMVCGNNTSYSSVLVVPSPSPTSSPTIITLPNITDTLVGKNTVDTLTNKTLTSPKISSISNSGASLTLPSSSGTVALKGDFDTATEIYSNLASDQRTGNGLLVFQSNPFLISPTLGSAILGTEFVGNATLTSGVAASLNDTLDMSTDNTLIYSIPTEGIVTFKGSDLNGATATTYTTLGAGTVNIGTSGTGNTTSISLNTDSTGDGEVVLPNSSIGTSEIADSAITTAKILDATISNNDISTSAGIAVSKLAQGTSAQILLNNSVPSPTWASVSGDATLSNTGVLTIMSSAVSTAKIVDSAVTTGKIADSAVTTEKINDESITPSKIDYTTPITAEPGYGKCFFSNAVGGTGVGGIVCDNASSYNIAIAVPTPAPTVTGNITITMPNTAGTVLLKEDINSAVKLASVLGSDSITGGNIFAKFVADTNPTLKGFTVSSGSLIKDANANTIIAFPSPIPSAVNYLTISNASTSNQPSIAATGNDTNISINLLTKGTGKIQANGSEVATISGVQTLTNKTLTSPTLINPIISSISNTGTLNLPTSTGTVALKEDFDTAAEIYGNLASDQRTGNGLLVFQSNPFLISPTLVSPTIGTALGANTTATLTSGVTASLGDTLDMSTDNTLIYSIPTDETVTFKGKGGGTSTNTSYGTTGAGIVEVGGGNTTFVRIVTDSTGDGEVVLPNSSIGTSEIADSAITTAKILDATISNNDISASATIDATKIGSNTLVDNLEYGYLNGVTSSIQTQLGAKASTSTTISPGTGLTGGGDLTSNKTLSFDYSKILASDPTLQANECVFSTSGILCEGATANAFEMLLAFPDPAFSDKTITLPNASTTLVGQDTTDTLTNKTLTSPKISSISNSGASLTLPISSGTVLLKEDIDTNAELATVVGASSVTGGGMDASGILVFNSNPTLKGFTVSSGAVIKDANTNTIIAFPAPTPNAVNYLTISNASTGNPPSIAATGTDTNISINLVPKGTTGKVQANGLEVATISGSQTLTNKTLTSPIISSISNTGTLNLPTSNGTVALKEDFDTSSEISSNLASDQRTGNGALVFSTSPLLSSPSMGGVKLGTFGSGSATITSDVLASSGDALDMSTDNTLIYSIPTEGVVTFKGKGSGTSTTTSYGTAGPGEVQLGGGSATAVSIGGGSVAAVTITTNSIGTGAVALPTGSIDSTEILDATISNNDISTSAGIAVSKLAQGTSAQILLNNSVPSPTWASVSGDATLSNTGALTIAASAVNTAKIADSAVTTGKIADSAVTTGKIADSAVTTGKIYNESITPSKIDYSTPITAEPGYGKCFFSNAVGGAGVGGIVCDNPTNINTLIVVPTPVPASSQTTITMPNTTGTVALKGDFDTATEILSNLTGTNQYTGTGVLVFQSNPSLISPTLGSAILGTEFVGNATLTSGVAASSGDALDMSTDNTLIYSIQNEGIVTFKGSDLNGATTTTYTTLGAGTVNIGTGGTGNTTSIILNTDGTGDNKVVLPNSSINTSEITDGAITTAKILDGTISNADISASATIDATKIGSNTLVDNLEYGYLNGVTSSIQTQLGAKASTSTTISPGTGLTGGGDLTSNKTLSFDYSKILASDPTLQANECVFSTSGILCEGATANAFEMLLAFPDPASSDKTITLPNASTTLVGQDTTDTLTNKTLTSPALTTASTWTGALSHSNSSSAATSTPLSITINSLGSPTTDVNGETITLNQGDDADSGDTNAGLSLIVGTTSDDADTMIGADILTILPSSAPNMLGLRIQNGFDYGAMIYNNVVIGSNTPAATAAAQLEIVQPISGSAVTKTSTSSVTGDKPFEITYQFRCSTTGSSTTPCITVPIVSSSTNNLECKIAGKRTGGSTGYFAWKSWTYQGGGTLIGTGGEDVQTVVNSLPTAPTISGAANSGNFIVSITGNDAVTVVYTANCRLMAAGS